MCLFFYLKKVTLPVPGGLIGWNTGLRSQRSLFCPHAGQLISRGIQNVPIAQSRAEICSGCLFLPVALGTRSNVFWGF